MKKATEVEGQREAGVGLVVDGAPRCKRGVQVTGYGVTGTGYGSRGVQVTGHGV